METLRGRRADAVRPTEITSKQMLRLGIDIGSVSSDVIVRDDRGHVVFKDYRRTLGRPVETVLEQLRRLFAAHPATQFERMAVTGSAGRMVSEILGAPFINEVRAQALGVSHLYPEFAQATVKIGRAHV